MSNPLADMDKPDVIFCIGTNMTECHPVAATRLKRALAKGAKMIVADPRRIGLADIADIHLPIRVGSDVSMLLAMAHVIAREGLVDQAFIDERTAHGEDFFKHVERYTPEWASEICECSPEDIEQAALLYGGADRAPSTTRWGITEHICGVDNVQSLCKPGAHDRQPGPRGHRGEPHARPEQHPGGGRRGRAAEQLRRLPGGHRSGPPGEVPQGLRAQGRPRDGDDQGHRAGPVRRRHPRDDH